MAVHASMLLYGGPPDCAVPGCPWPSTWTFHASGDEGVYEVVIGVLVESGDDLRLCDHHAVALRDECRARDDAKPWSR